jgi:CRP/FNR family cyclic AMP-dependent transcriptional regulator
VAEGDNRDPANRVARASFVERLEPEHRERLLRMGVHRRFARGEALMHAGHGGEYVMLLISGRVKVTSRLADGTEVILDFGQPGDLYGEMAVLSGAARMADVIAMEDVGTRQFGAAEFRRFLQRYPQVGQEALLATTTRLAYANSRRAVSPRSDATARLAERLVELVQLCGVADGDGWRIDLVLSQKELAQFVPLSVKSVDFALQRLRGLGVVRTGYRQLVVTDLARLRTLAEQ